MDSGNLEVNCGDPTTNLSMIFQNYVSGSAPYPTIYRKSTSVKCFDGYRWMDGAKSNTITCGAASKWNTTAACIGMNFDKFAT